MIESPVLQKIVQKIIAETKADVVVTVIRARFGSVPKEVATIVKALRDLGDLNRLIAVAATCPDLTTFQDQVTS
jgi:hypothetical protein